jgi:hypothetical protein
MILTQCAVCATELGLSLGKKCGRCSTRYCGPECQVQHWKEGGHDQLCKKIKKAGGAEQYNADQRYSKAIMVAAEACAEDTKGQTCYICTQALHWKTKEGLVRGCSCRGTAGFAHVSCLAEQAKILCAEAEENNLDFKVKEARFARWNTCSLCEQNYHGVVACALGWACWKTYVGRPETSGNRSSAMTLLGNGLASVKHYEDALTVGEAELAMEKRLGRSESTILTVMGNLAQTYNCLGREEDSLRMMRAVYSGTLNVWGEGHPETIREANNYAMALMRLERRAEAKELLRKTTPVARRVLGESSDLTLRLRALGALCYEPDATLEDLRESVETFEDTTRIARRVMGGGHPFLGAMERDLEKSRANLERLRAHERAHEAGKSVVFGEPVAASSLDDDELRRILRRCERDRQRDWREITRT